VNIVDFADLDSCVIVGLLNLYHFLETVARSSTAVKTTSSPSQSKNHKKEK
jgi:hypothetical protein